MLLAVVGGPLHPAAADKLDAASLSYAGAGMTYATIGNSELRETYGSNNCAIATATTTTNLRLPADAVVKAAYLYWGGMIQNPLRSLVQRDFASSVPLSIGGIAVPTTTGATFTDAITPSGRFSFNGTYRMRRADISSAVIANHPAGATRGYSVDIVGGHVNACALRQENVRAWHITVVYQSTSTVTGGTKVFLFDGLQGFLDRTDTIQVSGYRTPGGTPAGRLTMVWWQGDAGLAGEFATTNDGGSGLPDFGSDFANSSSGVALDIDTVTGTVQPNSTSMAIGIGTTQDVVLAASAVLQVENASVEIKKMTTTPTVMVAPGLDSEATYVLTVLNNSTDAFVDFAITDVLPAPFSYKATSNINTLGGTSRTTTSNPVPGATTPTWGSFRLQINGSVEITFTVTVPAAAPLGIYQNSVTATSTTVGGINNYNGPSSPAEDVTVGAAIIQNGNVSGNVFRDYDYNGTRDGIVNRPGYEPGEAGITITAFDTSGRFWTTTSLADGTYNLPIVGSLSATVRVEMGIPATKAHLQPGINAATRFTPVTSTAVNFSVSNPAEYCANATDLRLVSPCWKYGDQRFPAAKSTLESFPYNKPSPSPLPGAANISEATSAQIGTTWGLAYDPARENLFAGAYYRRHAGFGPAGTGAIYRIAKPGSGNQQVDVWANLNSAALFGPGTAGNDSHPPASVGPSGEAPLLPTATMTRGQRAWFNDINSFDSVGKVGLGDVAISEDNQFLYTVNLADRRLYKISASTKPTKASAILPMTIPLAASGTARTCPADDSRPMAVTLHNGDGFVGVVCSGQSTASRTNLGAYVYKFNPTTLVFDPTPVTTVDFSTTTNYRPGLKEDGKYNWWRSDLRPGTLHDQEWTSMMLSSIKFDGNDMLLGFRNRYFDQIGQASGTLDVTSTERVDPEYNAARGNIFRACANGGGTWTLESGTGAAYRCGALAFASGIYGTQGATLYDNQQILTTGAHVKLQGTAANDRLVSTMMDAGGSYTNGTHSFSAFYGWNISTEDYAVYQSGPDTSDTFGKANGLGDLEAICSAAPITIGDRVWSDDDNDGVQDPTEAGLPNIEVRLMQGNSTLATASTDASGQYLFSSKAGVSTPSARYSLATVAFGATDLWVKVTTTDPDLPPGLFITARKAGTSPRADSDAFSDGGTLPFDLTVSGMNNRDLDIGFATTAILAESLFAIGDLVWDDADNDGVQEAAELGRNNVQVELLNSAGVVIDVVTTTNGRYLFDALVAGTYRVRFGPIGGGRWSPREGSALSAATTSTGSDVDPLTGETADIVVDGASPIVVPSDNVVRATGIVRTVDAGVYQPPTDRPPT